MTTPRRRSRPRWAVTWRALVAPYLMPSRRRALTQLLNTALPYLAVMACMLIALDHGVLAVLPLLPVGAALLVRLFIIQHDCGHGSFSPPPGRTACWAAC